MCTESENVLTRAGMLGDPMIRAMMRSDGVSEGEYARLLSRVRAALSARETRAPVEYRLEAAV